MIIMKVHDSRKPSTVRFKDIDIGCAFFDAETGRYAMRITDCEDYEGRANAACLKTGILYLYGDNKKVVPIKAKIEVYA